MYKKIVFLNIRFELSYSSKKKPKDMNLNAGNNQKEYLLNLKLLHLDRKLCLKNPMCQSIIFQITFFNY